MRNSDPGEYSFLLELAGRAWIFAQIDHLPQLVCAGVINIEVLMRFHT
jgi:hypothetical protein